MMFVNQSSAESKPAEQSNCTTGQRQARNSSRFGVCQICGDKARIVNYGALSCQPCKTFFRRNGFHPQVCLFQRCFSSLQISFSLRVFILVYIMVPVTSPKKRDGSVLLVVLPNASSKE